MPITEKTDDDVRELVRTARDAGINFLDHTDAYSSGLHDCERHFAETMQLSPSANAIRTVRPVPGPPFSWKYRARQVRRAGRTTVDW
jgi:hypothetical protein